MVGITLSIVILSGTYVVNLGTDWPVSMEGLGSFRWGLETMLMSSKHIHPSSTYSAGGQYESMAPAPSHLIFSTSWLTLLMQKNY